MIFEAAIALLAFLSLAAMARVAMGPHTADRVVAFSTINTLVVIAMIVAGAAYKSVAYIDVAIVYCMISFVGTLFIARYLEGSF